MRNPLKSPAAASLGLLLVRVPIGMTFIVAGFTKFQGGVGAFVSSSIGSAPSYLPEPVARAYLYALPAVELLVGVLLLVGWFTRSAAMVTALVLISIMMALSGFWQSPTLWMPNSAAVLLSIALMLMLTGPGAYAVDSIPFGRVSRKPQAE